MGRLTGAARQGKAEDAYDMHILRVPYRQIAERLDIGKNLVGTLIREESARQGQKDGSHERQKAISTYERIIGQCWIRLGNVGPNSLNVSGLLNAAISAQKAIDDITGIKAADGIGPDTSAAISNFAAGIEAARTVYLELEEQGAIEE